MSNQAAAAKLAGRFRVFPLKPGTKRPAFRGWQRDAFSCSIAAFEKWPGEAFAPGICTDGLAVIDFDVKSGGLASLEALRDKLPRTYTVRTPSGGYHFYYRTAGNRRLASRGYRVDKTTGRETFAFGNFAGVDIRGEGGLVVAPGATADGGKTFYVVECDAPIATLPDELADLAEAALPPIIRERGTVSGTLDDPTNIARAIVELQGSAPAEAGNGGDAHTIAVANSVMDFGVSPETCAELMAEYWNPRCLPNPWPEEMLAYKVQSAARSRRHPIGWLNCDEAFAGVEGLDTKPPVPAELLLWPDELSAAALIAERERDLVRGIMGRSAFGVLYGDSGAGKSFVALDLAWALARGETWLGRRTTQTAVLYISAEGLEGFKGRILAARLRHGDTGKAFALLRIDVQLGKGNQTLADLHTAAIVRAVQQLREASGLGNALVIFDTLARVAAGNDENAVSDMTDFVEKRAKVIQRQAECAALIVHHTNKQGTMRGSSALWAAADLVMRADRDKAKNIRKLTAEKVKDGREDVLCHYDLEPVPLGEMPDGEPVGSCIIRVASPTATAERDATAVAREMVRSALIGGILLSPSRKSAYCAVKYLREHQGAHTFTDEDFAHALAELQASGYLARAERDGKPAYVFSADAEPEFTAAKH